MSTPPDSRNAKLGSEPAASLLIDRWARRLLGLTTAAAAFATMIATVLTLGTEPSDLASRGAQKIAWLIGIQAAVLTLFAGLTRTWIQRLLHPLRTLTREAEEMAKGAWLDSGPQTGRHQPSADPIPTAFRVLLDSLCESQQEAEANRQQLAKQNEQLQRANEVLAQLSITDGLTRLHNHRFFQEQFKRETRRADRTGTPLSMLLLDIDDFKKLNDRFGHEVGDAILQTLARIMDQSVRMTDLVARYGGEEFVVLASGTTLEGAIALGEKIRMEVEDRLIPVGPAGPSVQITLSCGVAQYNGDPKRFFRAADRALYRAKAEGKNCLVAAPKGA